MGGVGKQEEIGNEIERERGRERGEGEEKRKRTSIRERVTVRLRGGRKTAARNKQPAPDVGETRRGCRGEKPRRAYSSWRVRVLPSFSRRAAGTEAMAASSVFFWSWTSCRSWPCVERRVGVSTADRRQLHVFRTFSLSLSFCLVPRLR